MTKLVSQRDAVSIAPKRSESIWRELRVTDRMHDVAMSEIRLDRASVHAVVCEVKPGRVAQHVWMDRECNAGRLSPPLHRTFDVRRLSPAVFWYSSRSGSPSASACFELGNPSRLLDR